MTQIVTKMVSYTTFKNYVILTSTGKKDHHYVQYIFKEFLTPLTCYINQYVLFFDLILDKKNILCICGDIQLSYIIVNIISGEIYDIK